MGQRRSARKGQTGNHSQDSGEDNGAHESQEQFSSHDPGQVHRNHIVAADYYALCSKHLGMLMQQHSGPEADNEHYYDKNVSDKGRRI